MSSTDIAEPRNREQRRHPEIIPSTLPRLLDWAGAAEYLGTSEYHIKRLWAERRIAGHLVGRFPRFSTEDLDAYLESRRIEAVDA